MPSSFPVHLPLETAFTRRVLFAAEIVDAVTLEPVTKDIVVKATGLRNSPKINASGFFVWLEEGVAQPLAVTVDASATQYESVIVATPVLTDKRVRVELPPRFGYPFPPGVSALRGTLHESRYGTPAPVMGAKIWLQWSPVADTEWIDTPTQSTSDANGDFAALFRLTPAQEPKPHPDGGLTVRLRVRRDSSVRTSMEIPLQQGRITYRKDPFIWDELTP